MPEHRRMWSLVLASSALLSGCGDGASTDAGRADSSVRADAGRRDAALDTETDPYDGGPRDAALPDTGPYDAGPLRAGCDGPSIPITGISFDSMGLLRDANGGDLWPVTWADDNNVYVAGGDGDGFNGTRTDGLDVNRITGAPTGYTGTELSNKTGVLPKGLLSVSGTLYLIEQERGTGFDQMRIGWSTDHGATWNYNGDPSTDWDYEEPDGAFSGAMFLNYGRDYDGACDSFVYMVSPKNNVIDLARLPVTSIADRSRHEYFTGLDGAGNPMWTSDIGMRRPMFSRPTIHWGAGVSYNPVLNRYVLAFFVDNRGTLAIYEGPAPWGPWSSVFEGRLFDDIEKFSVFFVNKNDGMDNWLSDDGLTWYGTTSGLGSNMAWDSFNLVRARLTTD